MLTPCFGRRHPGACAVADEAPLEFCDGADDVEHQFPACRRRVNRFGEAAETNAFFLEAGGDLDQMREAAPQPVELPNDQYITGHERPESIVEFASIGLRAAHAFIAEYILAAGSSESVKLHRQVLFVRRDACVTDQHAFKFASRSRALRSADGSHYQMGSLLMVRASRNRATRKNHQNMEFTILRDALLAPRGRDVGG